MRMQDISEVAKAFHIPAFKISLNNTVTELYNWRIQNSLLSCYASIWLVVWCRKFLDGLNSCREIFIHLHFTTDHMKIIYLSESKKSTTTCNINHTKSDEI